MIPKPACLGEQFAAAFQDASVAGAYRYRPPYPEETFGILTSLIADAPRRVLDIGCGTGGLARHLAAWDVASLVDHVDAVDVSEQMIAQGKRLPHGDHPRLSWIVGRAESTTSERVARQGRYALITAGDSLHWMDWYALMPRLASLLTPGGYLAILGVGQLATPWDEGLGPIIRRYSTITNFQPYDTPRDVERRGLFRRAGAQRTKPVSFTQRLDEYVESFHGRASFSRERMAPAQAAAFDAEVRALVAPFCGEAVVELQVEVEVVWGKPLVPGGDVSCESPVPHEGGTHRQ
jgi:SAM-dependent methyltransferase